MSPEEVKRARVARYMEAFQKECVIETGQLHGIIETIFDLVLHPPKMETTIERVKALRNRWVQEQPTLVACKVALLENENDLDAAEIWLRSGSSLDRHC